MGAQVDDGVCDKLTWAMEGRLAAAHGFNKLGAAICTQVVLLRWRDCADFPAAAGVNGRELGGYDVWGWCGRVRGRFRGQETRDKGFLQAGGCSVGDYAREMDVPEGVCH